MRKLLLLLAALGLSTAAQAQDLQADPSGIAPLASYIHTAPASASSSFAPCVNNEIAQNGVTNAFGAGNTSTTTGGAQELGQSITAPCTGAIDSLYIVYQPVVGTAGQTAAGRLTWYAGAGTATAAISTVPFSFTVPTEGFAYELAFDIPNFAVTEGSLYTFFVDLDSPTNIAMHGTNLNPYAGGTLFLSTSTTPTPTSALAAYDLRFFLEFTAGSATATESAVQGRRVALGTGAPNPSSTQSTIQFQVREASNVRLAVYDVMGREVAVLAEGAYAPGLQTVTLNTSNLAAGAYVLRLQAENEVLTNRLSVIH